MAGFRNGRGQEKEYHALEKFDHYIYQLPIEEIDIALLIECIYSPAV
jgi:hypothetical protein